MTIIIKAQPGDSTDQMIKNFKKRVLQEQLLTELKEKEFFKKPSMIKKEKLNEFKRLKKRRKKMKWLKLRQ
ncbi:30S ribosomal protein S21 [Candidatus Beckwithbacteria bacterium CG2_30_44_31]|uniref:Small ribosomal subunit protein bS21 n=1 Tax=Candidatus Beckwithbacteria bacterium CG2_30_44_31 TaxID=1805035 RepID=A0A1J5AXC4_9BACT|nr:MAG: 30S ribosomal protein S21 [Candidatus Beckwithbacteria bacterium CG2_30_44_31]